MAECALDAMAAHLGLDPSGYELALLACDDARIAALNGNFRDKPRPTNVLSWPEEDRSPETPGAVPERPDPGSAEDPAYLGDIAIAYDTCAREAMAQGKPFPAHVMHLVVHGALHLLGYDHVRDADATLMERVEAEILGKLGLPDPYRE
nr:rRNA maturation RNase YbeY [Cognatishimia sp. F0-27]